MTLRGCAMALGLAALAGFQSTLRSIWDGVYTAEQSQRGEAIYQVECSVCHGQLLDGIDAAPALSGGGFRSKWDGVVVADMVERIRISMPMSSPGKLDRQQTTDVLCYILSVNGVPAGPEELPRQSGSQRGIVFMARKP